MPKQVNSDYEVYGEPQQTIRIAKARLEDVLPVNSCAASVLGRVPGRQLTGMVIDADDTVFAVIDFTPGNVYMEDVDNILTYSAGAPATFGAISIGDPVYYDRSTDVSSVGNRLSTSPLDENSNANPLYGHVVPGRGEVNPVKGGVTRSTQRCAIMLVGAGGSQV